MSRCREWKGMMAIPNWPRRLANIVTKSIFLGGIGCDIPMPRGPPAYYRKLLQAESRTERSLVFPDDCPSPIFQIKTDCQERILSADLSVEHLRMIKVRSKGKPGMHFPCRRSGPINANSEAVEFVNCVRSQFLNGTSCRSLRTCLDEIGGRCGFAIAAA